MLNGGPSLAERGAPAARREEGEYWTYLTDEQRSGRGPQPARRREPFDTSLLVPGGTSSQASPVEQGTQRTFVPAGGSAKLRR